MNLADYLTDAPWKARAACKDTDHSVFFPPRGDKAITNTQLARSICSGCAVKTECLDYALSYPSNSDWGIWGGTNVWERRKLRRRQAA